MLSGLLNHMGVGRRLIFVTWASLQSRVFSQPGVSSFPQNERSRKQARQKLQCGASSDLVSGESRTISSALFCSLDMSCSDQSRLKGRGVGHHLLKKDIKRICRHILNYPCSMGEALS